MKQAESRAKTEVDRLSREVRGCGALYAIRYFADRSAKHDRLAVQIEGGEPRGALPEGFVWLHGTARVCMRPFGHDGSVHGGWERARMTEKWRHAGPRAWVRKAVRPETREHALAAP